MKLKKVLGAILLGSLLAITPIFAFPSATKSVVRSFEHKVVRNTPDCDEAFEYDRPDGHGGGTHYQCDYRGEDATWCYYMCYAQYGY